MLIEVIEEEICKIQREEEVNKQLLNAKETNSGNDTSEEKLDKDYFIQSNYTNNKLLVMNKRIKSLQHQNEVNTHRLYAIEGVEEKLRIGLFEKSIALKKNAQETRN